MSRRKQVGLSALAIPTLFLFAAPGSSQERPAERIVPTHAVVLTGYGTVGHQYLAADGHDAPPSAFQASVSPVFLYQFQDRILFEAELEFELEEGATRTGLEYAQADVMLSNNLTLIAGKFLLPIGVFGERLHPTWINKMATMPPLFGHHGSGFGADPLLGIAADVGAMARGAFQAGRFQIGVHGYVTNGFRAEAHAEEEEGAGHAEEAEAGGDHDEEIAEIPELVLAGSSEDVSDDKMVGGRLDVALPPMAELNFSAFTGTYDEADELSLTGLGVAGELRRGGWELRGEYLRTVQEFAGHEGIEERIRSGVYAQLAYRIGPWEPLVRYTRLFDDEIEGERDQTGATQAAVGVDYWISPSIAVMASYELNREDAVVVDNDRLNVHLSFGF
jgi:hypothetical protein